LDKNKILHPQNPTAMAPRTHQPLTAVGSASKTQFHIDQLACK